MATDCNPECSYHLFKTYSQLVHDLFLTSKLVCDLFIFTICYFIQIGMSSRHSSWSVLAMMAMMIVTIISNIILICFFLGPLATILYFEGGVVLQAVSECPRRRWTGIQFRSHLQPYTSAWESPPSPCLWGLFFPAWLFLAQFHQESWTVTPPLLSVIKFQDTE